MTILFFMAVVNLLLALLCIYSLDRAARQSRRLAEILNTWGKLVEGEVENLTRGVRTLTDLAARLRQQEKVRLCGLAALEQHLHDLSPEGKRQRNEALRRTLSGGYDPSQPALRKVMDEWANAQLLSPETVK